MKRIISLLLVAVLCLSLAACGNKQYAKYDKLINYIETRDSQSALSELNKLLSESQNDKDNEKGDEKETETIDITLDNWQDYFDITLCPRERRNDFDELTNMAFPCSMTLKSEFTKQTVDLEIALEYIEREVGICPYTYNMQTREATAGSLYSEEELEDKSYHFYGDETKYSAKLDIDRVDGSRTIRNGFSTSSQFEDSLKIDGDTIKCDGIYYEIEITRIQGTITLK